MAQQQRRLSPEELAQLQEQDRQIRLEMFPPQNAPNGELMLCVFCSSPLHPLHNPNFTNGIGGFCNKLCAKAMDRKLINEENYTPEEASNEIDKYESYRRVPVVS